MVSNREKLLYILVFAAALLYNSWPLGYVLNPQVARSSLASGLEAVNQPYNWVFVLADTVSSLLIILACSMLWTQYKHRANKVIAVGLLCTVLFALGTIVDALVPEHCVPNLMVCPSFTQDHYLLLHGIFSILASVCLFFTLFVSWLQERKNPLLAVFLAGYVTFGMMSLLQAVLPQEKGNWSQDYYITLCSAWLLFLPYTMRILASTGQKLSLAGTKFGKQ
jgi:hypothetical protein